MLNIDDEYMGVDCTIIFFSLGDSFTDIKFTYIQFILLSLKFQGFGIFIKVSNHTTINYDIFHPLHKETFQYLLVIISKFQPPPPHHQPVSNLLLNKIQHSKF